MAKSKGEPFPLEDHQVFYKQTIREDVYIWKGPHVARLNEALGIEGDVYTDDTLAAVLRRQRARKALSPTGVVDRKTWEALLG